MTTGQLEPISADFSNRFQPNLAKEMMEFFDKIKAAEITVKGERGTETETRRER